MLSSVEQENGFITSEPEIFDYNLRFLWDNFAHLFLFFFFDKKIFCASPTLSSQSGKMHTFLVSFMVFETILNHNYYFKIIKCHAIM